MHSDEWYVVSTTGQQVNWKCLKESEASANAGMCGSCQGMVEENMRRSVTFWGQAEVESKTWSVRHTMKVLSRTLSAILLGIVRKYLNTRPVPHD